MAGGLRSLHVARRPAKHFPMPIPLRPLLALAVLVALCPTASAQPTKDPDPLENLKFRLIGPSAGGRVSRSAGVPGNPLVYYAAAASSGVWKTTDGGTTWKP